MKKLLVYLRPYRLQAILAPVFKLLEAAFELLVPLIMADIIDVGIAAGDENGVFSGGAHGSSGFHHRGSGSGVGTEREKRLSGTEFMDFFYEGAPHASALTVDDDNFFHNG